MDAAALSTANAQTARSVRTLRVGQSTQALTAMRPAPALPPLMTTPPTRTLNPAIGTFTSYTLADSLLKVTPKGGLFTTYTANSLDSIRNIVNPVTATSLPSPYYIEFAVDDTFDIKFRDNAGSNLAKIWIWIDELKGDGWQRVTASAEATGASALNGGAQVWRVTATALRMVRVFFHNCDFAGVRHTPTTIMQPSARTELKIALLGDSWMANALGNYGIHSLFYTAALFLGTEPLLCGQAGTGYITPTTDPNLGIYGDPRRTAPIVTAQPDLIITEGSLNDDVNSPVNATTIQAAATALYNTFAASLPKTKLIVFGPQSIGSPVGGNGDTNADRLTNRDAVKAAAQIAPNVLAFVDPITEKWVNGTGNSAAPTGIGTSDKLMNSTYHLAQYGHDTLARRVTDRIATILNQEAVNL
jgi:hypothetical protein